MYTCSSHVVFGLPKKGKEQQRNLIQHIIKTTLYLLMTSTISMQKSTQTELRNIKMYRNKVRKKILKVRILRFYKNFMHFCKKFA